MFPAISRTLSVVPTATSCQDTTHLDPREVTVKEGTMGAGRDGSVEKVMAVRAWRPKFETWTHIKNKQKLKQKAEYGGVWSEHREDRNDEWLRFISQLT